MAADPRYLIDSNIGIYLIRGTAPLASKRLAKCELGSVVTSSICLAEMLLGRGTNERRAVAAMLHYIEIMPFDADAAETYSTLQFKRRSYDRLIGAHALTLGLTLITANEADFTDIPGLLIEDWTCE